MGDGGAPVVDGAGAKIGVLFPGQGAQVLGMGKDWCEAFPAARAVFDRADAALGFPLSRVCFEGPESELHSTKISQPALFTTSAAILAVLAQHGFDRRSAALSAGLSLGEYTALHFAGAISFEDGLALVAGRGRYMQEACDARPSGMVSVLSLSAAELEAVCRQASAEGIVVVANVNSPDQIVLAGEQKALDKAVELAKARGARKAIPLKVAGAYHSPLMAPADERLAKDLEKVRIHAPEIPVISNVTAEYVRAPAEIRSLLVRQVLSTVRWSESMQKAVAAGVTRFYEVGPGTVLAGLMRKIHPEAEVVSIGKAADLSKVLGAGAQG